MSFIKIKKGRLQINSLKANIKTEIVGQNLKCYKCGKSIHIGEDILDECNPEILKANLDDVVIRDFNCENCGCNTFDVTVFIKVTV